MTSPRFGDLPNCCHCPLGLLCLGQQVIEITRIVCPVCGVLNEVEIKIGTAREVSPNVREINVEAYLQLWGHEHTYGVSRYSSIEYLDIPCLKSSSIATSGRCAIGTIDMCPMRPPRLYELGASTIR